MKLALQRSGLLAICGYAYLSSNYLLFLLSFTPDYYHNRFGEYVLSCKRTATHISVIQNQTENIHEVIILMSRLELLSVRP